MICQKIVEIWQVKNQNFSHLKKNNQLAKLARKYIGCTSMMVQPQISLGFFPKFIHIFP